MTVTVNAKQRDPLWAQLTLTPETSDAELDELVDTLATIWERTIATAAHAKKSPR